MTHVRLIYFKKSGKFYTDHEYDIVETIHFHEALEYMLKLFKKGEFPGLIDGANEFNILAVVYTEYGPLQWLFIKEVAGY